MLYVAETLGVLLDSRGFGAYITKGILLQWNLAP